MPLFRIELESGLCHKQSAIFRLEKKMFGKTCKNLVYRGLTHLSKRMETQSTNEIHKIIKITVYQCDLPLKEGSYNWCQGKSVSVFDSTIVQIDTDTGYS